MQILVAEDDRTSTELLRRIIGSEQKHGVTFVSDGNEAWSLLDDNQRQFDACILDIQMPGIDGLELAGMIRGRDRLNRLPIVLCSASSERAIVERARALAISGYIVKPYTKAKVLDYLRQVEAALPPPAPATPPPKPKLEERAAVCERLGIDGPTYQTLLEAMLRELADWADRLRSHPDAEEPQERLIRADGLKGACLSLGAVGAAQFITLLRPHLEGGDPVHLNLPLAGLKREIGMIGDVVAQAAKAA